MQDFKQHVTDFVVGLAAAMVTSAVLTGLQYIGAHISELAGFAATTTAAVGTIKLTR